MSTTRHHLGGAARPPGPRLTAADRLFDASEASPVRRRPRRDMGARLRRTLVAGLLVIASAGGSYILSERQAPEASEPGKAAAVADASAQVPPTPGLDAAVARPIWIRASDPVPVFSLAADSLGPDFAGRGRSYEAQRHGLGGQEDVIGIGSFTAPGPHLRLSVYRPGGEAGAPPTFFVDVVRAASEAGLAVSRTSVPRGVATKFGTMEVAEAQLAGHGVVRSCSAFRLVNKAPALRLGGWACDGRDAVLSDAALRCVVDGLAPAAALTDEGLRAFFRQARPAGTCAGASRVAQEETPADAIGDLIAGSALVPLPPIRPASFGRT